MARDVLSSPGLDLLLLRHGIAEERGGAVPDAARALTVRGRERSRAVLDRLAERGLRAGRLLASPLRRARETAELAVAAGLAPALELAESLAPGGDALAALPLWLESVPAAAGRRPCLLLVGHEPDLGDLAARLIGAPPGSLELRKAGLAALRLPASGVPAAAGDPAAGLAGRAVLRSLLTPRLLLG
jgi:phosphohistidine phosphatase